MSTRSLLVVVLAAASGCGTAAPCPDHSVAPPEDRALPLCVVKDVALPGHESRFDYQDIDEANRHLVVAHMGDSEVLVVDLPDSSVKATVPNVGTVRGVLAAPAVNRLFASASST